MTTNITPEMVDAWRTLQEFANTIRREPLVGATVRKAAEAVDVIDNSNWMVPIEQAAEEEEEEPIHMFSIPLSELNADGLSRAFQKNRRQGP